MNKNKGFTLIELLVVIAIIGILSSVVLASLNSARESGEDARAKANLANARAAAELAYSDSTGYASVCSEIAEFGSDLDGYGCTDGATSWAAEAVLSDGQNFCVDSTGFAKAVTPSGSFIINNNPNRLPPDPEAGGEICACYDGYAPGPNGPEDCLAD